MSQSHLKATVRIVLLMAAAFLAACAQKGAIEEPRELEGFDAEYDVETVWSRRASGRAERLFLGLKPDSDGDKVYLAGFGGQVRAVNAENGRRAWRVDLDAALSGGPTVGEGHVLVGSLDGRLFALDAEDGSERWVTQTGGEILAAPAIAGSYAVVKTADGYVRGFSLNDGGEIWSRSEDVPSLKMRGNPPPIIRGSRVLVGFENGRVRSFSYRDGQPQWNEAVGVSSGRNELEQIADIAPRMDASGNVLYAASAANRTAAINLSGGKRWEREIGSLSGLSIDDRFVFVTDRDSEVHALDQSGGASVWTQDAMRARQMTAPVAYHDTVVVGDLDGYLHFLSVETGELVARERISRNRINVAPVVIGELLMVQDGNGRIRALRLDPRD